MISDVDMLVHNYYVTIAALLDAYAPSVEITFRSRRSNKWFDEACQRAKKYARTLERRFRRTSDPVERTTWEESLRSMHVLCSRKRIAATMESIVEAHGDSRELWRRLDKRMGTTATRSEYDHTADDFADFFAKKIKIISQESSSAATPVFASIQFATMHQFTAVQPAHVVEQISVAPCKH